MADRSFLIRFPDTDRSTANQYAQELVTELKENGAASVQRQREDLESQDFGSTIILILGTASITAIARPRFLPSTQQRCAHRNHLSGREPCDVYKPQQQRYFLYSKRTLSDP
jgi:hypothetical protein